MSLMGTLSGFYLDWPHGEKVELLIPDGYVGGDVRVTASSCGVADAGAIVMSER